MHISLSSSRRANIDRAKRNLTYFITQDSFLSGFVIVGDAVRYFLATLHVELDLEAVQVRPRLVLLYRCRFDATLLQEQARFLDADARHQIIDASIRCHA